LPAAYESRARRQSNREMIFRSLAADSHCESAFFLGSCCAEAEKNQNKYENMFQQRVYLRKNCGLLACSAVRINIHDAQRRKKCFESCLMLAGAAT
jgi:hypothetical protein